MLPPKHSNHDQGLPKKGPEKLFITFHKGRDCLFSFVLTFFIFVDVKIFLVSLFFFDGVQKSMHKNIFLNLCSIVLQNCFLEPINEKVSMESNK